MPGAFTAVAVKAPGFGIVGMTMSDVPYSHSRITRRGLYRQKVLKAGKVKRHGGYGKKVPAVTRPIVTDSIQLKEAILKHRVSLFLLIFFLFKGILI